MVAQVSEPAVSRVSKPAGGSTFLALPIWKSAIQQTWKSAPQLPNRFGIQLTFGENLQRFSS